MNIVRYFKPAGLMSAVLFALALAPAQAQAQTTRKAAACIARATEEAKECMEGENFFVRVLCAIAWEGDVAACVLEAVD